MKLYNTLSKQIEEFVPLNPPEVKFYACGPTVYDYTHLGHIRTYINNDILRRLLVYLGFKVHYVMNITDVSHMTGDSDEGEDKIEIKAQKEKKTVWEIADFYTKYFFNTMKQVNVLPPDNSPKATEYINEMIDFIQELQEKNFIYETPDAIYFDTSKISDYGKLTGQKLEDKKIAVRNEVVADNNKKNPADFVLWFKRVGKYKDHIMHWDSPWGDGFPGWHIECSAMSKKLLGEQIDIHAGGVDHIPVHHTNEIAQSESLSGKTFVKYWFHNNFLTINGEKMSKSLNNFFNIDDIKNKDFDPLSLRYLFLQSHYRQQMNFTFKSLTAAQEGLNNLRKNINQLKNQEQRTTLSEEKLKILDRFRFEFLNALSSDLQTPKAMAVVWEVLKSNIPSTDKLDLILDFDEVLGLNLKNIELKEDVKIPKEIEELAAKRNEAKLNKNFKLADEYRNQINALGFIIEDNKDAYKITKKT